MKANSLKVLCIAMLNTETGVFVGVCDSLGVVVHGDSMAELEEAFHEAFTLLEEDLLADGQLDDFLRSKGWALEDPSKPEDFHIPWQLIMQENNERNYASTIA